MVSFDLGPKAGISYLDYLKTPAPSSREGASQFEMFENFCTEAVVREDLEINHVYYHEGCTHFKPNLSMEEGNGVVIKKGKESVGKIKGS